MYTVNGKYPFFPLLSQFRMVVSFKPSNFHHFILTENSLLEFSGIVFAFYCSHALKRKQNIPSGRITKYTGLFKSSLFETVQFPKKLNVFFKRKIVCCKFKSNVSM